MNSTSIFGIAVAFVGRKMAENEELLCALLVGDAHIEIVSYKLLCDATRRNYVLLGKRGIPNH